MAYFNSPYTPSSSSDDEHRRTYHLFNPYESVQHASAMPVHQFIYDLPSSPELLFAEEAALQGRTWGHRLGLYTGTAYLAGAALGAARGSAAGLREADPGESLKLRVNRVLNSSGQAGRRLGNSLGVLGLIFAGLESGISTWTGNDGVLSTVAAAVSTGAVYKAAAGPRSAAIAGAIGGLAAGFAVVGKQAVKRYVPI
ncbi:mitochondrial import inner membrane translocase subunit TIM23-2-like [Phoenix dactylifera]|uniref:Mitochondrial import inner membrane translocase subunit TIM23-2-like n=1 Tax=Phoenix dactylifera TaxID=42345 RepID=A0A8B7MT18_PHODC|nr:mitochondrial import inner membrane translocase subunit TIM23-2-like [Phoenix dactylifera]